MRIPSGGLAAAVLSLGLLAVACGGDAEEDATPGPSTSPSASSAPTPAATPTPESDGYLPVPSGVSLTTPGERLDLKESAVAAWQPRQDLVGVVDVAVTRVERTTVQASLTGFDLGEEEQRSTPYFVRASVANVGETDLGARQVPLYFLDGTGVLVAPTGVARDFKACPGSTLPAVFAPGDETRTCLIFLVPKDTTLQSIMFRPPEGVVPLQWTGQVTAPKASATKGKGRDRR